MLSPVFSYKSETKEFVLKSSPKETLKGYVSTLIGI